MKSLWRFGKANCAGSETRNPQSVDRGCGLRKTKGRGGEREGEAKQQNRWCILGVVVPAERSPQAFTGLWTPSPNCPRAAEEESGGGSR